MSATPLPAPVCHEGRAHRQTPGRTVRLRAVHGCAGSPAGEHGSTQLSAQDRACVEGLRRGDEATFAGMFDRYHGQLLRLARVYVRDPQVAEEIVQDTWVGVIRGIDRFEGRSSLKTWLFRILVNTAKKRAVRERRTTPFSSLTGPDEDGPVDADRLCRVGRTRAEPWTAPFPSPAHSPIDRLLALEAREVIDGAIARLPTSQRQVIIMHDIDGCPPREVCDALSISEGNQRVLLHRARAKVRSALEHYLTAADPLAA